MASGCDQSALNNNNNIYNNANSVGNSDGQSITLLLLHEYLYGF